ncbi:MAG: hypothetical protein LC667_06110, partial [Thioalkalivibrio sp.]|nr:hypothetical protein [Thioalkalivibrio sp.]
MSIPGSPETVKSIVDLIAQSVLEADALTPWNSLAAGFIRGYHVQETRYAILVERRSGRTEVWVATVASE